MDTVTRDCKEAAKRYQAPAVARAAGILTVLSDSPTPLSLAEIASQISAPKSSVFNICNTLVANRMVLRTVEGGYRLGPRLVELARAYLANVDLTGEFQRAFEGVDAFPDELFSLLVRESFHTVFIATRKGSGPRGMAYDVGSRLPAHCSASGKTLLTRLTDDELAEMYRDYEFESLTTHSVTRFEQLLAQVRQARQRGYSVCDEEVSEGMMSFAAPVRDDTGLIVAAVSVRLVKATVDERRMQLAIQTVMSVANRVSISLGSGQVKPEAAGN